MEESDDPEEVVDSDDESGEEGDENDLNDSEEPDPAIHDGTGSALYDDEQPHDIFGDPIESPKVAEVDDSMGDFNLEQSDSQVPVMDEPIFDENDEEVPTDSQLPEESHLHGLTQPDPEVLCIEDSPEKDPQAMLDQRREIEDKISELTVKLNNARKQSAAKIFSWFMLDYVQQKHIVNPEPLELTYANVQEFGLLWLFLKHVIFA